MTGKKYTTPDQRKILAKAGIEHVVGRSYEEAEALIDKCIQRGVLAIDIRDRASIRQLALLDKHGIPYSGDISKAAASHLLDQHLLATDKQIEFLRAMGADIPPGLTKKAATALIEQCVAVQSMSEGQANFITELGGVVVPTMTYENASEFIDYLLEHELRCSRCGARDDRRSERCSCGAYLPRNSPIRPPRHLLASRAGPPRTDNKPSLIHRFLVWLGLLENDV